LLWVGISLAALALLHRRFRFEHRVENDLLGRALRRFAGTTPVLDVPARGPVEVAVPRARRSFGPAMRLRQTLAIGASSFGALARSPAGLFLLLAFPAMLVLVMVVETQQWGVP